MFEALRGTKLELPVLVAAFYGFRRGEVLGLKWDAVDFERETISVIRTVTTITVDGKQIEGNVLPVFDGGVHTVEVVMG